jgi:hypothetical protein
MRAILILAVLLSFPALASRPARVKGHVTKTGRYVAPHVRTAPDSSKQNNWSTKGNVNPYTGKRGTK